MAKSNKKGKKSSGSKGNKYKLLTKKYYISQGYVCEYAEKLQAIFTPRGMIYIKRDMWGADGVAMNGKEMIFWNSKLNRLHIAEGIKEFLSHPYPPFIKKQLVIWEEGSTKPQEIIEVK
jgi:hypothetical protein